MCWLHFKCADVLSPESMENKDVTCTLCIENLMYTANNQHMDSVNEELTHDKQTYNTDSSSNTFIEATQNPHDGFEIAQLWILIFLLHFLIVLYILYLRSFPSTSEYVVLKVFLYLGFRNWLTTD
jgi:hypothetical protein